MENNVSKNNDSERNESSEHSERNVSENNDAKRADDTPQKHGFVRWVTALLRDQRIRFLIVGTTNTVVGYLLYSLLYLTMGQFIGYLGALYGSYVLSSILAFFLYRRFVFHVSGHVVVDFIRFQSVYIVALAVNTLALPFAVEFLKWSPLVAQLVIVMATTVLSYVGHKFFSFRRRRRQYASGTIVTAPHSGVSSGSGVSPSQGVGSGAGPGSGVSSGSCSEVNSSPDPGVGVENLQ